MVDPFEPRVSSGLLLRGLGLDDDRAAPERVRREFRQLGVACRMLAGAEPALITRVSVALPAGDDLDAPDRIAGVALSLAAAYGLEAEVEVARGWVTVFLSRTEEES